MAPGGFKFSGRFSALSRKMARIVFFLSKLHCKNGRKRPPRGKYRRKRKLANIPENEVSVGGTRKIKVYRKSSEMNKGEYRSSIPPYKTSDIQPNDKNAMCTYLA